MGERLGKLKPPYPFESCANGDCQATLADSSAYLFKDLNTGKLVIVCDDCAIAIELRHADRFTLVAL